MSVRVIAQMNPLSLERDDFKTDELELQDIIRKLDPSGLVDTGWRIMVNDRIIEGTDAHLEDGDTVYIKLIPEGTGNQTQDTGKGMTWAGGVMAVIGAVLICTGYGAGIGVALLGAGVGCLAGGIAMMNIDIPDVDVPGMADREAPVQDPSLRGSRNQPREGGYIPILFGRRRIYPDLAMNSYTWVEGGVQYLYQLFCAGQKDIEIDRSTYKINETLLAGLTGGSIDSILNGSDPYVWLKESHGEPVTPIIDRCVHEFQFNKIISHTTDAGLDASIIQTTPDGTDEIHVDIFFNNGLGRYNDKGKLESCSVTVAAYFKPADAGDGAYSLLGYFTGSSNTVTASHLKTLRYSIDRKGLVPGSYTVKLTRHSGDSSDSKIIDKVYLGSIRACKNEQPVSAGKCRDLTLIGLRLRVSEKINGVIDKLNFIAQSKLPVPDVSDRQLMLSSNPASCAIWAMQGYMSQQKIPDSQIDWQSFARLYRWCDSHDYECNVYLTESMTIKSLLSSIAGTCRSEIYRYNGMITVIQDIERESYVQIFTPRNSSDYEETITMTEIPDSLKVQFTDRSAGYADNELEVFNTPDGNKKFEPDVTQDLKTWGVTSSEQARRIAMFKYAVIKHRGIICTWKTDFEYMLCRKGDWIKYAGDIAIAGIRQGRISQVLRDRNNSITGFVSDELLPMQAHEKYGVKIRLSDNTHKQFYLKETDEDTETDTVYFTAPADFALIQEQDLFIFGKPESDSLDLIITDISCDNNYSATITAVNYAPEIFGVDSPGFVLPEFINRLSETSGKIDSGAISSDSWQTFYTYNDSIKMPDKPTGNGTDGDWHPVQTDEAVWFSFKTAPSVYEGEWSPPRKTNSGHLNDIADGTYVTDVPDNVSGLNASAEEKGIQVSCGAFGEGLKNNIKAILFEIQKGKESEWMQIESAEVSFFYEFDRAKDGYPEYTELQDWKIRAKAVNAYGKSSTQYAECLVNTDGYGTWNVTEPLVNVRISDRTITLICSQKNESNQRKQYGNVRYGIRVRCSLQGDPADFFFKPNEYADPESNELAYKISDDTGYIVSDGIYIQTMPLHGQNSDNIIDTPYQFQVFSINEAGNSPATIVTATAVCTSIKDLVRANETAKEAYISSLSAITANLGVISQGSLSGNDNNYWALSTITDDKTGRKYYQGAMKIGGTDQYIKIMPVTNNREEILSYEIEFKVGNFTVNSTASSINGELIVQETENSVDRTRITPEGTYYEHRDCSDGKWYAISKQETRGLQSAAVYAKQSMIIGNSDIEKRRALGHDIGRPYISDASRVYHFDTNLTDQYGTAPYDLTYLDYPVLKGREDNSPLSVIDFTPAILAVAPYSEIGKALYGQYKMVHHLGYTNFWTVDFWIQYIWAENQVLFRIGNAGDTIYIVNSTGESNYNEYSDGIPYNTETAENDELCYNIALTAGTRIYHQGKSTSELVYLEGYPFYMEFNPNTWLHFAIVMDSETISLWINEKRKDFERYEKNIQDVNAVFNENLNSFILDELMIDNSHNELFSEFCESTRNKIPFAGLDYREKFMVFDYDGSLKSNIFESEDFKDAVRTLIQEDKHI